MEMVLPTFPERKVGRTEGYKKPLLIDAKTPSKTQRSQVKMDYLGCIRIAPSKRITSPFK